MTETKQQALTKMLEEMNTVHSPAVDKIHNWICEQEDDELFTGIINKDKNLNTAFSYVISIASKMKQEQRCVVLTDEEVYDHIVYYFKNEIKDIKPIPVRVETSEVTHTDNKVMNDREVWTKNATEHIKKIAKPEPPKKPEVLMNIFDFMEDVKTEEGFVNKAIEIAVENQPGEDCTPVPYPDPYGAFDGMPTKDPADFDPSNEAIKEMAEQPDLEDLIDDDELSDDE